VWVGVGVGVGVGVCVCRQARGKGEGKGEVCVCVCVCVCVRLYMYMSSCVCFSGLLTPFLSILPLIHTHTHTQKHTHSKKTHTVLASLRSFTQSKNFLVLEGAMLLSLLALVDGAWSGDWTEYGYISTATEQYMKSCSLQIGFGMSLRVCVCVCRCVCVVGGMDRVWVYLICYGAVYEELLFTDWLW
jgi:hypothetical protein